jgi:ComF family protein
MKISEILRPVLDVVLPERCPACGKITPSGGSFCADCWQNVEFLAGPSCIQCNLPLPFAQIGEQSCAACLQTPPLHDGIFGAVAYGDIASTVALRLKYAGKIGLAKMIAGQLGRFIEVDADAALPTLLVPVPLHWTRLWSRSYNQSALIAQSLAKQSRHLVYAPDMLLRIKRTPYLRGLSAKQRKETVGKAFTINPKRSDLFKNADIILVDDVYTTGATTDACVRIMKKAGAARVRIFCWARVLPGSAESNSDAALKSVGLDLA